MFGLEKGQMHHFEFDLAQDLKNAKKKKETLSKIEKHVSELKEMLKNGSDSEEFEQYGVLLHGYSALKAVVERINN